ncbi:MAG: hypothetical protein WCU88_07790 [Elusimicrobiota bacterium]|jgi:hypothetical protein
MNANKMIKGVSILSLCLGGFFSSAQASQEIAGVPPVPESLAVIAAADPETPVAWEEVYEILRVYDPSAEAFVRVVFDRMQDSAEGRRVTRLLISEYQRESRRLIVRSDDFSWSKVVKSEGIESIDGVRGLADPDEGTYTFNRLYMTGFQNRAAAEVSLAANMGREFRRLFNYAYVQRVAPERYSVFTRDFVNEQSVRLTGYHIAFELDPFGSSEYSQETAAFAKDPAAHWGKLMLMKPEHAVSLTHAEMADPVKAYSLRMQAAELEDLRVQELQDRCVVDTLRAVEILTENGEGGGLEGLTEKTRAQVRKLAMRRDTLIEDQAALEAARERMSSPEGARQLGAVQDAARDEVYGAMDKDFQAGQSALLKALPRPVKVFTDFNVMLGRWNDFVRTHPEHQSVYPCDPQD